MSKAKWVFWTIAIAAIAWLVLPTGDPSDMLITIPLLLFLGPVLYMVLAVSILALFLAFTPPGQSLWKKIKSWI